MEASGKKLISLFLIFSLLMINCATLRRLEEKREKREKHGAVLIIQKIDSQQVRGELITVKPNSLLLLDTEGKDVSIDIVDIKVIRVVKKSKALRGAVAGGVIGALGGIGFAALVDASGEEGWGGVEFSEYFLAGAIGLGAGALYGALISALFGGKGEKIRIEGKSDLEIQETLDKLRKKARIRDYK